MTAMEDRGDDRITRLERVEHPEGVTMRVVQADEVHESRSLGELFADLSRETSTLVRQEVTLAKAEMTQAAKQAGKGAAYMAVGGALAYAGLLVLLFAVVIALAYIMPAWLSALLVGIIVVGIGAFLAFKGLGDLKSAQLAPKQTIETLKEDTEWAKEQVR